MTVGHSILNENLYRCECNIVVSSPTTRDKSTTSYFPGQNGSNYNCNQSSMSYLEKQFTCTCTCTCNN